MMLNCEIEEMDFDDAEEVADRWACSAVFLYRWSGDTAVGVVPGADDCVFDEDGVIHVRMMFPDGGIAWCDHDWLVDNVMAVALGVLEIDGDLNLSVTREQGYRVQVRTSERDQRGFLATVLALAYESPDGDECRDVWTWADSGLSVRKALLGYGIVEDDEVPRPRRSGRRQRAREQAALAGAQAREQDGSGDEPDYGSSDGGTGSETDGGSVGGSDCGGGSDMGYSSAGDGAGDERVAYEHGWAAGYAAGCGAE